jgi:hypothetical protein
MAGWACTVGGVVGMESLLRAGGVLDCCPDCIGWALRGLLLGGISFVACAMVLASWATATLPDEGVVLVEVAGVSAGQLGAAASCASSAEAGV